MNSGNSKFFKPHVLILKLVNKLDLRIDKNSIDLSDLSNLLHVEKHKKLIQ